ncbi:MAG: pyridoxamine 5'-phosphate oxidase family protein [Dokdonella sp.]|uniref:pyridoxamine 5'-phosphate oxidase family protein n=1 Tax=Dokdonella sp. TaxID=2291710 RepID=UPI0032655E50
MHAILDAGMVAHVGFCVDGQPFVIPMMYARIDNVLLLHGSIASRLMGTLGSGIDACISVTHIDGLVLARSHFDHSMNYRSVVAFGRARLLDDPAAKAQALSYFVDAIVPGRAAESRAADRTELAATHVLQLEIADASAKIRSGGVKGNLADADLPHWAGVIAMRMECGAVEPDETVAPGTALPASVSAFLSAQGPAP